METSIESSSIGSQPSSNGGDFFKNVLIIILLVILILSLLGIMGLKISIKFWSEFPKIINIFSYVS